jgi:hypothetical protein
VLQAVEKLLAGDPSGESPRLAFQPEFMTV